MNYQQFDRGQNKIFLIDMRREREYPFSEIANKGMAKMFKSDKNVCIIHNKTGFASGAICQECGHIPECKACSVPIAYHKDQGDRYFGICHICKSQYPGFATCNKCSSHDIDTFGLGSQQLSKHIDQEFGIQSIIVDSSKTNSPKKASHILSEIKKHHCTIGTSLLTEHIPSYKYDLVIVPMADMGINYPDYQSNWYNFLILYELFTKHTGTTFLIQSYNPEHYAIQYACSGDIQNMKITELEYRKKYNYPPYTDMCIIRYKHEVEKRLYTSVNKLNQELLFLKEKYEMKDLEIYTTPPLIYKIYHKYRYNIILKGPHLREFVDIIYSKLKLSSRGFKVDREAESLTG